MQGCGLSANFLGYNYQEEEWLDMPKAINGWKRGCFIVNLTVRMNWR